MKQVTTDTDVLVIGGGSAGCWAAIRARELTPRVTLVEKAVVARSGASSFINCMLAPASDEEFPLWRQELVERGEYLNDQDWVEILLREQTGRVQDLTRWGVPFERDVQGKLVRRLGRGHLGTRVISCHGLDFMGALKKKVQQAGVELVQRVMITDLLTSDGQYPTAGSVIGAVGLDVRTGDFHIYKAKAVVIAAGPMHTKKRIGLTDNLTGDGVAMAFRAGTDLQGLEFCTRGNIVLYDRKYYVGSSSPLQGMGVTFVNAIGERFMPRYDPVLKERSRLNILCQAFTKEALEGRGPVYVDFSAISEQDWRLYCTILPVENRSLNEGAIRSRRVECTPVMSMSSDCGEGGIRIGADCGTNLPGLYAAGSCAKNPAHGTYSVAGVNIAFCNVSGYRAGEAAAHYGQKIKNGGVDGTQVKLLQERLFAPLGTKTGIAADEVFDNVNQVVTPARFSVFKNKRRIHEVLDNLEAIGKERVPRIAAPDIHELVKAHEAENILLLCKLVYTAALQRRETRFTHYLEEYPYRDDKEWLKWVMVTREGESGLKLRSESVPIDRYPVRPQKRLRVPHPVQLTLPGG